MNLNTLLRTYDAVVIFDTETTGLDAEKNQIIELAAIRVEAAESGLPRIADSMDDFIRLPEGEQLDPKIVELTNITDAMLQEKGKAEDEVATRFHKLITASPRTSNEVHNHPGKILLVAHNAQFDLLFVRQLLKGHRLGVHLAFLDSLTVYRDRAPFPHKLEAAIKHYKLENKVKNSHRAIDDTCALLEVLKAMDAEREDLHTYVNVFGYNPRYGISGEKIAGITYHAQDFTKFKRPEYLTLPALALRRRT